MDDNLSFHYGWHKRNRLETCKLQFWGKAPQGRISLCDVFKAQSSQPGHLGSKRHPLHSWFALVPEVT
jgi:hypothetical protein